MKIKTNKQVVVGMSGGVDSSVSLLLLKEQGYEPVGVSLKLPVWENKENRLRENVCCTKESLNIAKMICKKVGATHVILDVSSNFKKEVIDYFVSELKRGKTPNPCTVCNRFHKFKELLSWAHKNGIRYVATGHYAKKDFDSKTKKYVLKIPKDKFKDQTYNLSYLTQKQLRDIIFPLGELTKEEVFRIAEKNGLEFFLKRKQSQDFCFVSNKSLQKFIEEEMGIHLGNIRTACGDVIGKHKGLHFYAMGQKKGLGLKKRYYVAGKDKEKNELFVVENPDDVLKTSANLNNVNFISGKYPKKAMKLSAKTGSNQVLRKAVLHPLSDKQFSIVFEKPVLVSPGQFCVFYKNKTCLGGGIIE